MEKEDSGRFLYFIVKTNNVADLEKYLNNNNKSLRIKKNCNIDVFSYDENHDSSRFSIHMDNFIEINEFMRKTFLESNYIVIPVNPDDKFFELLIQEERIGLIDYFFKNCSDTNYYETADFRYQKKMIAKLLHESINQNGILLEYLLDILDHYKNQLDVKEIKNILSNACQTGNIRSIQLVLDKFISKFGYLKEYLLYNAAVDIISIGIVSLLEFLQGYGISIVLHGLKFLRYAITFGNPQMADHLLSQGADMTGITYEDIEEFVKDSRVDGMRWIFTQLEFEQDQIDDLFLHCYESDPEMVELLIEQGADLKKYKKKLLKKAKNENNKELVQYLEGI